MTTTPRFLSATNGFVPEATGQVIAYIRKPGRFKLTDYVQFVNHKQPVGVYAELDPDFPVRVVTDEEYAWEDGDAAPMGNQNMANFKWTEFRCFRRAYPYTLGHQALENASWNAKAFYNAAMVNVAMVNKTYRTIKLLEDATKWPSDNTADANVLNNGAGLWSNASGDPTDPGYLAIKKSILEAVRKVFLKTNGMVEMEDLRLVLSPGLAIAMSETDEINSFLQRSPYALDQVRGDKPGQNALWGLPDRYAGVRLVVEDATRVKVRPTAAGGTATLDTNKVYVKSDTSAILCSRPGGLEGEYGAPSFSTVQIYHYKYEMAVEAFDDPQNKRVNARVVDQFKEVLAAGAAGFLITNCK